MFLAGFEPVDCDDLIKFDCHSPSSPYSDNAGQDIYGRAPLKEPKLSFTCSSCRNTVSDEVIGPAFVFSSDLTHPPGRALMQYRLAFHVMPITWISAWARPEEYVRLPCGKSG